MDPKKLGFNLREIFESAVLTQAKNPNRKFRQYEERGSSVNWNDSEFATPI